MNRLRLRLLSRKWRTILLIAIVIALATILVVWRLTWMAPSWYAPPSAVDPGVVQFADVVENRLVQEAHRIREPDSPWTLRLREEQVNAWLAARLRKWVAHESGSGAEWPPQLGTPQVRFSVDEISVALPLKDGEAERFLIARINPEIVDGQLRLRLERVQLGRVSLPGEPLANLLNTLNEAAPSALQITQIRTVLDWLNQREAIEPILELSDGRRVRLINVRVDRGTVDVTARTALD